MELLGYIYTEKKQVGFMDTCFEYLKNKEAMLCCGPLKPIRKFLRKIVDATWFEIVI